MGTLGAILNLTEITQKGAVLHRIWLDADRTIFPEAEQTVKKSEIKHNTVIEREIKKSLPFALWWCVAQSP